jgi:hypothetical protein
MPAFAARSAHVAAAPARLLRHERAAAALARVLRALHLMLLRLHGESMCVWPIEMHTRERGWEHNTRTHVDPGCMLHHGGQA